MFHLCANAFGKGMNPSLPQQWVNCKTDWALKERKYGNQSERRKTLGSLLKVRGMWIINK